MDQTTQPEVAPLPPASDSSAPVKDDFVPGPWDSGVAAKKLGWGLAQFHVAVLVTPTLAPQLANLIDKVSSYTEPYGVGLSVDQAVFEKSLPTLIFIILVVLHDYLKVRTKQTWL